MEKLGEGEYGEVKKGKLTRRDLKGKKQTVNIYYSTMYFKSTIVAMRTTLVV